MWRRANFGKGHFTSGRNRQGHSVSGWCITRLDGLMLVEIPSPSATMHALVVHSHADAHPRVQSILEMSADLRNRQGSWISLCS